LRDIGAGVNTPDVSAKLAAQGAGRCRHRRPAAARPQRTRRWTEVIKASGIKVEQ
jgi:hypothetical protein